MLLGKNCSTKTIRRFPKAFLSVLRAHSVSNNPIKSSVEKKFYIRGHSITTWTRWGERGSKNVSFCPRSGYKKCPRRGGGVHKCQISVHVVVEWPLVTCNNGLRTPNEGKNQRNLKIWSDVENMLRPYLKIWEWEWIFGRDDVKAISSPGVRSPCLQQCMYLTFT